MALADPAGGISCAEYRCALTLANTTEWIAWTGSANAEEAMSRIYFDALPHPTNGKTYTQAELEKLRPFAIIWAEERGGFRARRIGAETWEQGGRVHCVIEDNVDPQLSQEESEIGRAFKNHLGKVIGADENDAAEVVGLCELAHRSPDEDHTYLAIESIDAFGPFRVDEKDMASQGDYLWGWLFVDWGVPR